MLDVFFYFFVVVEMMLDTLDDLIVFVSFSCDENHIIRLRQGTSRLDGCGTVFDNQCATQFVCVQSICHVLEYLFRVLIAWVVTGKNELFATATKANAL